MMANESFVLSGQFNRVSQRIVITPAVTVAPDTTNTTANTTTTTATKRKTNHATTQVDANS